MRKPLPQPAPFPFFRSRPATVGLFLALLLLANRHLLAGAPPTTFAYDQAAVLSGQWWRLITHPFTHVSWYHLGLDSAATMLLWAILPLGGPQKLVVAAASGAASLALALVASPLVADFGLCGLSGIAHGLMAATGLLLLRPSSSQGRHRNLAAPWVGGLLLIVALGKSLVEVTSGTALFATIHEHHLGIPIVHAHLGGCCGALLALPLLARRSPRLSASADNHLEAPP